MAEKWELSERGRRAAKERYGDDGDALVTARFDSYARWVDEDWSYLFNEFITNGIYAREVMTTGMRELIAVAALTTIHSQLELKAHIEIALRNNPPAIVREAIVQTVPYIGFPPVYDALGVFYEVMDEPEFADAKKSLGR